MSRLVLLGMTLLLLLGLFSLAQPQPADAAGVPMTITTVEAGSGALVPGACYAVSDEGRGGGGIAAACDDADGANDGRTVLETTGPECSNCGIRQTVRPAQYLEADRIFEGASWADRTFVTFLKPFMVVSFVDAKTGAPVPGACIAVSQGVGQGADYAGCDGIPASGHGDQDGGAVNGHIVTRRLPVAGTYRVLHANTVPGYYKAAPVEGVVAGRAETGEFVPVTIALTPIPPPPPAPAKLTIKTVDNKTGRGLKGACYVVRDQSHGGSLGRICDGVKQGANGDQDGRRNGAIVIKRLPGGHTYLIDQKKAPPGYRLFAGDKRVTTAAGANKTVTFKNRPKP